MMNSDPQSQTNTDGIGITIEVKNDDTCLVKKCVKIEPELLSDVEVKQESISDTDNGILQDYDIKMEENIQNSDTDHDLTSHGSAPRILKVESVNVNQHKSKYTKIAMNVDTERVIYEVRERPILWDLSHSLYKDRDARIRSWSEVYETLYPGYDSMEESVKKEIEKSVQQRWKTARDAYMRCKNTHKNTGSGGSRRKMYVYSDEMTFLDKKNQTEADDSSNTAFVPNFRNEKSDTSILHTPNTSNQEAILPPKVNIPSKKSVSYTKTKNLRKRKHSENDFDKEMMLMIKENAKLMKNDDLAFFMSLLPITEKFSVHQKLIFRSEVLKKAMEIGNMPNPYESNRSNSEHSYYSVHSDSTYQHVPVISEDDVTQPTFTGNYD